MRQTAPLVKYLPCVEHPLPKGYSSGGRHILLPPGAFSLLTQWARGHIFTGAQCGGDAMTPEEALNVLVGLARDAAGETEGQCDVDTAERVLRALVTREILPCRP